uniref:CCHC-type domain-containing protein n=1 Tax=Glossina pallidipes TaxID=7398 RepID=A0A1B0AF31_GLOPL
MQQVSTTENDHEIAEKRIPTISLDDSSQGEEDLIASSSKEIAEQTSSMEEGELADETESVELLFEIKFSHKRIYDELGELIIKAIQEKLEIDSSEGNKEINYCIKDKKDEVLIRVEKHKQQHDLEIKRKIEQRRERDRAKEQSPDLSGLSELFTIDTDPVQKLDSVQVPSYKRAVKDVLLDEETETQRKQSEEKNNMKRPKQGGACFNCGATEHGLKDCPMPRNPKRIRTAKKFITKSERYHVDVEQRFAHLRPGRISDNLREAMCLKRGELPFFFYRMRYLGYPPGWLEDAKVEHSGITLFNSDVIYHIARQGSAVLNSDQDEGEVEPRTYKYDASKIIDFPGFNQYPGENFYDDYRHHNVPPFDKRQLKDEFIKSLGDNVLTGYKRKKLKDLNISNSTTEDHNNATTLEITDMEIEDADSGDRNVEFIRPPVPPMELSTVEDKPPPPPPPISLVDTTLEERVDVKKAIIDCDEDRSHSPSLEDLQAKQLLLLQELQANISITSEHEDSTLEVLVLDDSEDNINSSSVDSSAKNNNTNYELPANAQNKDTKEPLITESFVGTPVIKFSPYDCLPTGENFKVGVSDVINFENLPDSTGKYAQMKKILKRVRDTVHTLNNKDE